MTIKSQPLDFAVSIIAVAGCAFGTCKNSTDIPACFAIARTSSRILPARSLQAASKLSNISRGGTHPACPLASSTGNGSVTVMTVTLAFKAFAKATPCLTPFLATSDPSVLKRILAYIGGSLLVEHSPPKSDAYSYGSIVRAREEDCLQRQANDCSTTPCKRQRKSMLLAGLLSTNPPAAK